MSKKHYKMLAGLIRDSLVSGWSIEFMARLLADELQRDNPRFDSQRFLFACGLEAKP